MDDKKYIVRLWDGFDYRWYDITKPLELIEAQRIWNERTKNGTENTKYDDIDYYSIFPSDTLMLYREK